MFHEPAPQFYYSAYRVDVGHTDPDGKRITGSATAFVIADEKGNPWLITNRHVVDRDYRQPTRKYKDFRLSDFQVTGRRADDSTYTLRLHPDAKLYFHSTEANDVVVIEPRVWLDDDGNKGLHWHFGVEQLATPEDFSNSIHALDLICYSGFPEQHDRLSDRPLLRSGRIASDPKYNYSWDLQDRGMCVAYEGFSSEGASGSPVYAPARGARGIAGSRNGLLVGVNAGHIPAPMAGHSGISYFYKSAVIIDILIEHGLREA